MAIGRFELAFVTVAAVHVPPEDSDEEQHHQQRSGSHRAQNEIQTLLKPLTDRYFQNGQVFDLESVYKEVVVLEKEQLEDLKKDVVEKFRRAEDSFTEVTGEEQEFLQKFALICLLSFDVYMKKMIVEQLVADLADTMKAQEPEKEAHKKKN